MLSHGMTWPYNQRDMGLSNKFDAYRSCRNGNITFLFCQLTSCNHMIKGTYDLVSGSQSTYAITVKFDAYRCCGNRDTAFLFCHMVCDHIMKWSTWSCMLYRGAHIYIYIKKNFTKQCFGLSQEWSLITLPLLQWYLNLWYYSYKYCQYKYYKYFKTFRDVRCTKELIDLWWMNGELWMGFYTIVCDQQRVTFCY